MLDASILVLRLLLATLLFVHASQKLLGWFGGNGLKKQALIFESLGLRPGVLMVALAAIMEISATVLLALGLATPLAALIAAGTMVVAGLTMQMSAGSLWNSKGGGEYPYVLAILAVALGIAGGGVHSIDALLVSTWPELSGFLIPTVIHAVAITILAVLAAIPFPIRIRSARRTTALAETEQDARS